MNTVQYWRLDDEDCWAVRRLAAGLGHTPARVLAYLVLRAEREDDPATGLEIRIGTERNWNAVSDALERLEDRGLVSTTTLPDDSPGRPPKAWRPVADIDSVVSEAYDRHARALLRRADVLHRNAEVRRDAETRRDSEAHRDAEAVDSAPVGSSDSDSRVGANHPVRLALNWQWNGLHVPFYAAKSGGHYEDRGVRVEVEAESGSRRAIESVVDGDADVALAGAGTVVRALEADEPIYPIAVVYQRATTLFYTTRETFGEPLESVDQFRDRRIGMPGQSETGLLGRLFVSQSEVRDCIRFVETAGEEREALLSGDADVVTGSIADPHELENQGFTVDSLLVADHFPIYGHTLVAHHETLDRRRTALRRFLAGTVHGWTRAATSPTDSIAAVGAASGTPTSRIRWTAERAVEEFGESDAVRERGWGWQRAETWDRLRTALSQAGLVQADA